MNLNRRLRREVNAVHSPAGRGDQRYLVRCSGDNHEGVGDANCSLIERVGNRLAADEPRELETRECRNTIYCVHGCGSAQSRSHRCNHCRRGCGADVAILVLNLHDRLVVKSLVVCDTCNSSTCLIVDALVCGRGVYTDNVTDSVTTKASQMGAEALPARVVIVTRAQVQGLRSCGKTHRVSGSEIPVSTIGNIGVVACCLCEYLGASRGS